jgi:surface protein
LPTTKSNPTESPTIACPSASSTEYCFPDRTCLKTSVDNYINEGCETTNITCATRSQYGVIGDWCIKFVTDMNTMFSGKSSFNSNISKWEVGRATNMEGMFGYVFDRVDFKLFYASSFNSDCHRHGWHV